MSYTNLELVRHHLEVPFPIQSVVRDQPIVLPGDSYVIFFGGTVDDSSIAVKAVRSNDLTKVTATAGESRILFIGSPIIPGSVLVASDGSLGQLYVEGLDYVMEYGSGAINIKTGSSINVNQEVTVWYQEYHVYSPGADYLMDSSRGSVKRVASGNIGDGETVYLDYRPLFSSYKDELLSNAVAEANALVERAVDPERQFGADLVLQSAATYRALEIVCRASAARELSSLGRNDKAALAWMKLADSHAVRSEFLLNSFRPPHSSPAAPVRS
jgi:hypothetical protein